MGIRISDLSTSGPLRYQVTHKHNEKISTVIFVFVSDNAECQTATFYSCLVSATLKCCTVCSQPVILMTESGCILPDSTAEGGLVGTWRP